MKKLVLFVLVLSTSFLFCKAQKNTKLNTLAGKWIYASSSTKNLGNIPDNQLPELLFDDSTKTVAGSTGCNTINGSYATDGDQITFGTMVSTNKACSDMEVENHISNFLTNVGWYKIENEKLYLFDKNDRAKFLLYKRNNLI